MSDPMSLYRAPSRLAESLERAIAFHQRGRFDKAERLYQQILKFQPDQFDAVHMLGVIRAQQGRNEEALKLIEHARLVRPGSADVHANLGNVLQALGRHEDAITSYDKALAANPRDRRALNGRGNALQALGRYEEALEVHDRALAIDPGDPEVLNSRGAALARLNRHAAAITCYDRALTISPDYVDAVFNRGQSLAGLTRYEEAIESFEKTLSIRPEYGEAIYERGSALANLNRHEEAAASFEKALAIDPELPHTRSGLLRCHLMLCNWNEAAKGYGELQAHAAEGRSIINPFYLLPLSSTPLQQMTSARAYVRSVLPIVSRPNWNRAASSHGRIRLAYLSADFRLHAVASVLIELLERHDKTRFEVLGVSFGVDDKSEMRSRIAKSFDQFHDARFSGDREIAGLLNSLEVDIAVDLMGYTLFARPGILAHRPAPVQVSYLGYPATTGADFLDYVIADPIVLPFDQQPFFTENIVHLPDCYLPSDSRQRTISDLVSPRSELGLPEHGFVFCAFTQTLKIAPPVFEVWMRLLRAVEGSVLWLSQSSDLAMANLRREAQARGVDPARLIFAPWLERLADHLARQRQADLYLDTLPYNAHTTASNALWAGLPVLTCKGQTFASRVCASVLMAAGLPELVTDSLEAYEALALKLAADRWLLQSIRRKLEERRLACPMFDTDRYRRNIEAAYATMWDMHERGESPRSFRVEPS